MTGSIQDNNVPDSTISGNQTSEKLQNIYAKNVLFQWHLSKVQEYETNVWHSPESVLEPLRRIKYRLSDHLVTTERLLNVLDPKCPLPMQAAPPELSHNDNYTKKKYGWAVIRRLKDLFAQVLQELADIEAKGECNEATAER